MFARMINAAVEKPFLSLCFFACIAAYSVYSYQSVKIDAIPDIGDNQQIVFTEWPGRSPKDIEDQITYPLSIHLQGIPGVKTVRGLSAFGFSTIYVVFKEDVDFYWSRSRVLEKISTSSKVLPSGVEPVLGPDATGLGQIFWYTVDNAADSAKPLSLAELRSIQDFSIKYLLQGVDGVSEVASIGGFVKEYQVDVDPKKLFAFDTHFSSVLKGIKASNIDVGAEVIEEGGRELIVRGKGFFKSLEDIENVVLDVKNGSPVRIKDIARVGFGPAFRRGALDRGGQEAVGGVVAMRFGENPKKVIDGIKERLERIREGLPPGVEINPFYDRTELIDKTIGTVKKALFLEIGITIVIVFLFLMHVRSSLLVSITLPFGVGISFLFMHLFNIDSNIMSLSGLVIAIGSMVDMGIIMTENIHARLAARPSASVAERITLIKKAAVEVGPAILTAVLTTVVTFLPVFALHGPEGKLFTPLAWTKSLAMLGSVAVAMVLIPVLSVYLLRGKLKPVQKGLLSRMIIAAYRPCLKWVLHHKLTFLTIPALLLGFGMWSYAQLGKEFMPSLNEGDILYMPVTTPDVSMSQARELLSYTDKVLQEHPLVESAVGKLGRVDSALDPAPIGMFETVVKLIPQKQWPRGMDIYSIMQELDAALQVPGLVNSWDFPIQTRIAMISTGIKTQVGIKILGDDLRVLESLAASVASEVEKIPGATGVYAEKITGKPYIEFDIDRVAASRYGINTGTINEILQTAVGGMPIGQFYEGRRLYPIRVRYKKELRDRVDDLKNVLVPSPLGKHIPISQLADVKIVSGPAAIQSENGILRSTVQLNVKGRDISGFVEEAKIKVSESIDLPSGYTILWAGQYEDQVRAENKMKLLIPLALIINIILIYLGTKNLRNALVIFLAVPVAFSGGLILLWALGYNASVAVWVGFIALFGIAVDDGVVMMTYLRQNIAKLKPKSLSELQEAVVEAGCRRIRPLLMTTITTVAALLPVMWSQSTGSEIMKPMAVPTIGGMLVALITLFIVPLAFSYFEGRSLAKELAKNNDIDS